MLTYRAKELAEETKRKSDLVEKLQEYKAKLSTFKKAKTGPVTVIGIQVPGTSSSSSSPSTSSTSSESVARRTRSRTKSAASSNAIAVTSKSSTPPIPPPPDSLAPHFPSVVTLLSPSSSSSSSSAKSPLHPFYGNCKPDLTNLSAKKISNFFKTEMVGGVPAGVPPSEYIEYRKCKYVEDIRDVRVHLTDNLNPMVMADLMATMYNISQFNNKHEHGLLTLQAMLANSGTKCFRIAPAKFHKNFSVGSGSGGGGANSAYLSSLIHINNAAAAAGNGGFLANGGGGPNFMNPTSRSPGSNTFGDNVESRIGTTLLHFTLKELTGLTTLDLEKCACDSLLLVLSEVSPHLKYLNISGSAVSDQGLLYLAGVGMGKARRSDLQRECKTKSQARQQLVRDVTPRNWVKQRGGCKNLVHLGVANLQRVVWPAMMGSAYTECCNVPLDSGFVAILMFLPKLEVLVSEVGARAVQSYCRNYFKWKKPVPQLKLKALGDTHMLACMMDTLTTCCPSMSHLRVHWYENYSHQPTPRENWLSELPNIPNLRELSTADIDFKTDKFRTYLPSFGANLTVLELKELWKIKYSNLRAIKEFCPKLTSFSLAMTTRGVISGMNHIQVDKDYNLQLNANEEQFDLTSLESCFLVGPFGNDVVRYLISGSRDIRTLTLSIEWLSPTYCDNQPLSRKDILGKEYLEEVVAANPLSELTELHLMAQFRRGRGRLNRTCYDYVLETFPKVTHLGNFTFWSLNNFEVRTIAMELKSGNRKLTIDEDLHTMREDPKFEYKYVPGRFNLSCNHTLLKKDNTGLFSTLFEVMAVPNLLDAGGILMDSDDEDDEDEDLDEDDDDGMDGDSDDDMAEDWNGGGFGPGGGAGEESDEDDDLLEADEGIDQVCVVM